MSSLELRRSLIIENVQILVFIDIIEIFITKFIGYKSADSYQNGNSQKDILRVSVAR